LLNEKRLFDLIDAGLSIIQISVDGIKEDHERLRGLGTYDKVIENIKLVNESGINYRIGSVVNAINYKNLRKFITDMKNIGVNVINFFRYMPINGNDTLALSKEQLMVVSEMLVNMYKKNRYGNLKESFYITFEPLAFFAFLIDKSFAKISQCTAGKAKFSLACNGDIYLCNYIRKKIGNINKDKIDVIWERISYENSELNQIPENCIDCDSKMYCQGGCKGFSFMQNNDYRTKDSACFKYIIEQK
jgi:radical SAM protein with 4Fe4S-binding SPASM domain